MIMQSFGIWTGALWYMQKRWIGHLHYDVFLLLRPEFILFFLSYLNLVIPVRPLDIKSPNLHKKEKSWRILVVLVKDAIV